MIPYEKLSAALDAHRRRVRGEPEPAPAAEPEILDASDLVAEEDSWGEPADQGDQWAAQEAQAEAAPPLPPAQDQSWDDPGQDAWPQTTDEWQEEPVGEPAQQAAQTAEPLPVTPDEWNDAPIQQPQTEWTDQPAGAQQPQAEWTDQPAGAQQPQAEDNWPEEPPLSPEDFAPPERVDGPLPGAEAEGDEWAIPTVPPAPEPPPAPEVPAAPQDLPPAPDVPPAPADLPPPPDAGGPQNSPPAQGQPARTIFGMPAPPTQPPAPQDQQAGQGDDLVIVDDEPDNKQ